MFFLFKAFLKHKRSLKNFGGSKGSKGQGSNPNNRINENSSSAGCYYGYANGMAIVQTVSLNWQT